MYTYCVSRDLLLEELKLDILNLARVAEKINPKVAVVLHTLHDRLNDPEALDEMLRKNHAPRSAGTT